MSETAGHILVVDDDTRLRDLLRQFLSNKGFVAAAAPGASQARAQMASMLFDLLIVDVMMPGEDGVAFTRTLRQGCDIPVLMLTARAETADRIAGLEAGGDDYLAKPFEPRELLLRIEAILRRRPRPEPWAGTARRFKLGGYVFDCDRRVLSGGDGPVKLTGGERALLSALAAKPGEIVSREALADAAEVDPAGRAVDVQITRLRKKIEPNSRDPEILLTVRGKGYALRVGGP